MPARRPRLTNEQVAVLLAAKIASQIRAGAGKGLNTFRTFLTARIKEELSVPAPRRRVISRKGVTYYVATTPAIPNAPPRKLSGTLRMRVYSKMLSKTRALIAAPTVYSRRLELDKKHPHKFFEPVFRRHRHVGAVMLGREVKMEMRS
jgi:hypothetical protein